MEALLPLSASPTTIHPAVEFGMMFRLLLQHCERQPRVIWEGGGDKFADATHKDCEYECLRQRHRDGFYCVVLDHT